MWPAMSTRDHLQRLALALPARRPTVLFDGSGAEIARGYPALDETLRAHAGYRLVIAVPADELAATRRRYPHEIVLPAPAPVLAALWRWRLGVVNVITPETPDAAVRLAALPPLASATGRHGLSERVVALAAGQPIASIPELKHRLGAPRAILCLGNGPSSEDPRLHDYASGAALFRVNWNWRGRGFLEAPDVVFTVDPDPPGRGCPPVLLFPSTEIGVPILRRHLLRGYRPRAGYGFLDRFQPPPAELSGRHIPTNGALMVALAAALAPERLVIAGIDLYRHPEGRYPGDTEAVDGYSREHRAELDLAVIGTALDGYRGEVVILSDNLKDALGR